MGVDGVRDIDPLDGVGEGGGSGEVPGDPREGNGSVDCSFALSNTSGGKFDGTFLVSTVRPSMFDEEPSSSEESLSSWLKWKMARGCCDL